MSESGGKGMHIEFGVEIAFTYSNGTHWVRRSTGKLIEIKEHPLDFYDIDRPVSWSKVNGERPKKFTDHL